VDGDGLDQGRFGEEAAGGQSQRLVVGGGQTWRDGEHAGGGRLILETKTTTGCLLAGWRG